MRIPSIRAAAAGARRVSIRFPLVLPSALVAAVVASLLFGARQMPPPLVSTLAAATLGLSLFTALALAAERSGSRPRSIALGIAGLAALLWFALAWPHWTDPVRVRRCAQLALGFHLLVAFLPWLNGREPNGFWQYNRSLFLRFLVAGIHSAVLFAGLSVALLALDRLLGLKVHNNAYARLWFFVVFVFNTWFFLGGIPEDLGALESRRDYPRALKVFSQFILIPIVVIYLAILTAYLVRILVTGQWPSNWIGYLVSSVAIVGILSILLIHPLRDDEGHRWVGRYARWFYLPLLPSVGMLLVAIGKRIQQYGITEDRYFIAILAGWLAAISVTFLLRQRAGLRWIPITLCALAFATLGGPLGPYQVSRKSQTARLRSLLEANRVLVNGAVVPATPASSFAAFDARKEISNVLAYLLAAHGETPVRAVLGGAMPVLPVESLLGDHPYRPVDGARKVMEALGLTYVEPWESAQTEQFNLYGWRPTARAVAVRDVGYHVPLEGGMPAEIRIEGESWRLANIRGALALTTPRETLWFAMDTLVQFARAHGRYRDSTDVPRITRETHSVRVTLAPRTFSGSAHGDSVSLTNLTGDLYVTILPRSGPAGRLGRP